MQGQANHFIRYSLAPEPIPYAIDRYKNETRRLYRTVDTRLRESGADYLVGSKCTIADIALWCWVNSASESSSIIFNLPIALLIRILLIMKKSSLISILQNFQHCRLGTREWRRGQQYRRDIASLVALT